ncbi:DtxR family transcriptional regulator [candidate division KSB1 bacterium]|nr:DtxR family transcriptional regulator [candidate division KSB1 bacterium]
MTHPLESLIFACLAIALALALFWPQQGFYWQIRRGNRNTERVVIEDALKHFYDREERGSAGTLASLAGSLEISHDKAASLIERLQKMDLLQTYRHGFRLKSEGRSYALRVIRIHRLWERYLADETGVPEVDWHREAEFREHRTSADQAEEMAARMGNPQYDPHGDPIPSSTGELPPSNGILLTHLPVDELALIVHIEDEPEILYKQLVAQALHPGMKVQIAEKSQDRIVFIADGEEIVLAPVAAGNVTVEPLPKEQEMEGPYDTLDTLSPGENATVIGISRACRGMQRRRLMDLGVVPGTTISAEMRSAGGDPTAYGIRGATIALRSQQAKQIFVNRKEAA